MVMPSNACGWRWHCLARETGLLGHLYSPGGERGPWPHLPYGLDNGAFPCWDGTKFDDAKWDATVPKLLGLWKWGDAQAQRPLWAVVPDVVGDASRTLDRWVEWAPRCPFPRALAVQDGMEPFHVRALSIQPEIVFVGGGMEWKLATMWGWVASFPRVHIGRMNRPALLEPLRALGAESCDGTGWMRGDENQERGLESYLRAHAAPLTTRVFDRPRKGRKK